MAWTTRLERPRESRARSSPIEDPATLRTELAVVREHYNSVRLHAGIGYVTPNDEHEGRAVAIRKAREPGSNKHASGALPGTEPNEKIRPAKDPPMLSESP